MADRATINAYSSGSDNGNVTVVYPSHGNVLSGGQAAIPLVPGMSVPASGDFPGKFDSTRSFRDDAADSSGNVAAPALNKLQNPACASLVRTSEDRLFRGDNPATVKSGDSYVDGKQPSGDVERPGSHKQIVMPGDSSSMPLVPTIVPASPMTSAEHVARASGPAQGHRGAGRPHASATSSVPCAPGPAAGLAGTSTPKRGAGVQKNGGKPRLPCCERCSICGEECAVNQLYTHV